MAGIFRNFELFDKFYLIKFYLVLSLVHGQSDRRGAGKLGIAKMKIVLIRMNCRFGWDVVSEPMTVRDAAHAMQIVFAREDASGGRDSYNYREVQ